MGNWEEIQLGKLCKIIGGGTPKTTISNYWGGDYVWLSPTDLPEIGVIAEIKDSKKRITKLGLAKSSAKLLPKGTVLYSSRATIGKIGIAKTELTTNQGFTNFICSEKIINTFLAYALKRYTNEITDLSNSTTFKEVSKTSIRNFKIPLPPLPEQKRIVAKLNGLFEKIDQAISLLEENIQHTQALMGSVLDDEFGKLDCKNFALKDISEKIQYGYTGKTKDKGEYYYLRITDIQDSQVNYNKTPFSDIPDDKVSKYIMNKGDILFARTGATAGKSYLYNDEEKSVFASYLIRVVVNQKTLSPFYLKWYFQSDDYWNQIFGNIVGAAQPNFNGKKLGELNIPVPNLQIQNSCAEKFEKYDKVIRASKESQTNKLDYLKALKSSLLDQAFKGEF